MKKFSGKAAIVTGASRGIGRAVAIRLAAEGISVLLTARDADRLADAVAAIESAGGQAIYAAFDLREPEAAECIVERAIQAFGGVDIVINNAGATKRGAFLTLTEDDWSDGFALKFFGAVRLIRAAWPHLMTRKGSIVTVAGVGGRTPGAEFTIGGSVNAALLSLTKVLADQGIADGVQVNAINPGTVRTDRLQARLETQAKAQGITIEEAAERMIQESGVTRFGEPEEIAGLIAYMVSPQGRLLHGSLIDIDGGRTKTI